MHSRCQAVLYSAIFAEPFLFENLEQLEILNFD